MGISGAIAGSYIIVERLTGSTLFSIFLKVMPALLRAILPNDETILWFTIRAERNLYGSWDVALIYLLLLPIVFSIFLGCWVFLILKLLGIFELGTVWLILWFFVVAIDYFISSSNQYALELKYHDRRLGIQGIKNRMRSDPFKALKRWSYYFISNSVRAPYTTLKVLLITVLFVLLHWPAWLIRVIPAFRFDLTNRKNRRYYYAWYAAIFIIAGLLLNTLF